VFTVKKLLRRIYLKSVLLQRKSFINYSKIFIYSQKLLKFNYFFNYFFNYQKIFLINDFSIIFIHFKPMIFLLSKLFLTCNNYFITK